MATINPSQVPNANNAKYTDFLTKFKKQRKYFEQERTASGKPWPRPRQPDEIAYDNFLAETIDPATGDYYTDNETGQPAGKYVVETIIRYKLRNGSEYLVSQGHINALDYFRHRKTFYADKPEMHIKTLFDHETRFNPKTRGVESVCKGPYGKPEEIYEMPFTPENLEKLWSMRRDDNISLILKTQSNGVAHSLDRKGLIKSNDALGAYELFKNADFDYLFNWEYTKEKPTATTTKNVITNIDDIGTAFDNEIDQQQKKSNTKSK